MARTWASTRRCSPPRACSATSTPTRAGARSTMTTWSARPLSWRRSSWRSSCGARATATTASGWASTSTRTPRTRSRPCGAACCTGGSSRGSPSGSTATRCGRSKCARTPWPPTSWSTRRLARSSTFVGLDVGTTGVKAIAVSPEGEVVARAEREYPLSTPAPGWAEQDPDDWWRASEATLADVGAERAAGIGLSGQMHGLVALDGSDRVIRPAILWNDQRTAAECAEIEERVGFERLVELTGNRALTGFTAPKLLWLRRHEPDAFARIARVLLPKDYVRLRLTGEWAIDVSDASGTLLLDVGRRAWSDEVLAALDLPAGWLPPLLESPQRAGE